MRSRKRKSKFEYDSPEDYPSPKLISKTETPPLDPPKSPQKKYPKWKRKSPKYLTPSNRIGIESDLEYIHASSQEIAGHLKANCILLVGAQRTPVKIIKQVLEAQSVVFKQRFETAIVTESTVHFDDPRSPEVDGMEKLPIIDLEDVELETFQNFLRYLQRRESTWNLSSLKIRKEKNVISELLSLQNFATKFNIKLFLNEIDRLLNQLMTTPNLINFYPDHKIKTGQVLCQIFESSNKFSLMELRGKAFELILKSPKITLDCVENLEILSCQNLQEILMHDNLQVASEVQVFQLVIKWLTARTEISQRENEKIFEILLPTIRFTRMTLQEFMNHVWPTKLLGENLLGSILPVLYWKSKENQIPDALQVEIKIEKCRQYSQPPDFFSLIPPETTLKIFLCLTQVERRHIRKVSKLFKKIIDENCSQEIILTPKLLQKILDQNNFKINYFHPYNQIKLIAEELQRKTFDQLHRFVEYSNGNKKDSVGLDFVLDLDVKLISNQINLFAFLEATMSSAMGLKINLKISKFLPVDVDKKSKKGLNVPKKSCSIKKSEKFCGISTTYFQITHLHLEFLITKSELRFLIQMSRQCPNLTHVTVGNFGRRTKSEIPGQTGNIIKFLKFGNVDNLKISLANFGNNWLTAEFFQDLKSRGVAFKKINLDYDVRINALKFINIFSEILEQIFDLEIQISAPLKVLQSSLTSLKVLSVHCSVSWLIFLLQICPILENLFWSEIQIPVDKETINKVGWIDDNNNLSSIAFQLPKLERIVVSIKRNENFRVLKFLSAVSPAVRSFSFEFELGFNEEIKEKNVKIIWIYKYFPMLEQLEFCENEELALQAITGLSEAELTEKFKWVILDRPPFIGHLQNLKILNLGLMNYQELAKQWKWRVDIKIFSHGIGHLSKLEQIILPPLEFKLAKRILRFLVTRMKTVQNVKFQIWDVPFKNNRNETMREKDVENLIEDFKDSIKSIESIKILEDDGIHYTNWI